MAARKFIGTLNNPEVLTRDYLEAWHLKGKAHYVTGQLEKGKEGTPHIQFYLHYNKSTRFAALKKHCPKAHFQKVGIDNGAGPYCNKDEGRCEGPYTFGVQPARQDKKGDVARRNKEILEYGPVKAVEQGLIAIEKFKQVKQSIDLFRVMKNDQKSNDDMPHEWHYGATGLGKSRGVREKYPEAYIKANNIWWDGYDGQPVVIVEDIGPKLINAHHIKLWCDHYAFAAESKGGSVKIRPKLVIFTSNYHPQDIW